MRLVKILGSVWFAICLITLCAIGVIAGTFIESASGSHKVASRAIYASPLFLLILWGFFVNILMATINRWPFQKKHIPFIITHLGLLMVISGTLLKISFGTQGALSLKEGLATKNALVDDSWALSLKKRGANDWIQVPLKRDFFGRLQTSFSADGLDISIRALAPHGQEQFVSWIKNGLLTLIGHPPIPVGRSTTINGREVIATLDPDELKEQLTRLPALIFYQEAGGQVQGVAIDADGKITHREYDPTHLKSLYAYDEGRVGYSVFFPLEEGELEAPVDREFAALTPPKKAEEERPLLSLTLKHQGQEERVTLSFLSTLPTGIFDGQWLIKFAPQETPLPHTIRLRRAEATLYPNTNQPRSYTAHLYVDGQPQRLSMNNVWESQDGWRFYLANISPLDESAVKQVRLVVNHDPFKWWLTYPGAIVLAIGIALLFFGKRARKILCLALLSSGTLSALDADSLQGLNANNDHGLWLDQTLTGPLCPDWTVDLSFQERWGNDYKTFYYELFGINFDYNLLKYLSDDSLKAFTIGPGFNSIRTIRKNTESVYHWVWVSRYMLEANITVELYGWDVKQRLRGEYETFSLNHYPAYAVYRHRAEFWSPWKLTANNIRPYFSNEWFFRQNSSAHVGGWYTNRFRLGLGFTLIQDKLNGAIYWQWRATKQKPGSSRSWNYNYQYGLSLTYHF